MIIRLNSHKDTNEVAPAILQRKLRFRTAKKLAKLLTGEEAETPIQGLKVWTHHYPLHEESSSVQPGTKLPDYT